MSFWYLYGLRIACISTSIPKCLRNGRRKAVPFSLYHVMSSLLHHILEKPSYTLHYVWDICFYHVFPTILILPDTLLFQLFFQLYRVFKQPIKKTPRHLLPSMRVFSRFSLGKIIFWLQVFWTLPNTKLHIFCIYPLFVYKYFLHIHFHTQNRTFLQRYWSAKSV